MAGSIQAKEKLEGFINKLESLGYIVKEIQKRPHLYLINGKLVNIRSRGMVKETSYGRVFWYSIAFSVLKEVKGVIYMATAPDYFVKFSNSFLESIKDKMYPDEAKAGVGVFNIDWDNEMIELKQGELKSISEYYYNLVHPEDYPQF